MFRKKRSYGYSSYSYSKKKSISGKTIGIILGVLLLVGAGFGFYQYQNKYKSLEALDLYKKDEINTVLFNFLYGVASTIDVEHDAFIQTLTNEEDHEVFKYYRKLARKGYDGDSIVNIYKNGTLEDIQKIADEKYNETIDQLANVSYFRAAELEDYLAYSDLNENLDSKDIVLHVNLGIDQPHYEGIKVIDNYDDLDALVNKYYELPSDYEPKDLVLVAPTYAYGQQHLRDVAYNAFVSLAEEIKAQGMQGIIISSAYRSIAEQQDVYDRFVKNNGQEYADAYAARAGHSEHHLGLTADIVTVYNPSISEFHTTDEYQFIVDNVHRFGFTLHYTPEKSLVTGYNPESWHIRYVGVELATFLYENNLSLDEYYAMNLDTNE